MQYMMIVTQHFQLKFLKPLTHPPTNFMSPLLFHFISPHLIYCLYGHRCGSIHWSTGNLTVATIMEKHDYPSGCHQPPIAFSDRDRALWTALPWGSLVYQVSVYFSLAHGDFYVYMNWQFLSTVALQILQFAKSYFRWGSHSKMISYGKLIWALCCNSHKYYNKQHSENNAELGLKSFL